MIIDVTFECEHCLHKFITIEAANIYNKIIPEAIEEATDIIKDYLGIL